jgi:hypothetical protein
MKMNQPAIDRYQPQEIQTKSSNFDKEKAKLEYLKYSGDKPQRVPYAEANRKDVVCFNCYKKGHYMSECYKSNQDNTARYADKKPHNRIMRRGKVCKVLLEEDRQSDFRKVNPEMMETDD